MPKWSTYLRFHCVAADKLRGVIGPSLSLPALIMKLLSFPTSNPGTDSYDKSTPSLTDDTDPDRLRLPPPLVVLMRSPLWAGWRVNTGEPVARADLASASWSEADARVDA